MKTNYDKALLLMVALVAVSTYPALAFFRNPRVSHIAVSKSFAFRTSTINNAPRAIVASFSRLNSATSSPGIKSDDKFLDYEFSKLADKSGEVAFFQIMNWEEVKDLLEEEVLSMEEVSEFWRVAAGGLNAKANREAFGAFNKMIDTRLEDMGFVEDDGAEHSHDIETDADDMEAAVGSDSLNVWDPSFDPIAVFDKEVLNEITDYFTAAAGSIEGDFSYRDFMEWPDVQEMLSDGSISKDNLQLAWREAATGAGENIDYDAFLRLNVRLDLLMDESEEEAKSVADSSTSAAATAAAVPDAEEFYRSEFSKAVAGAAAPVMSLEMLLDWDDIAELIRDGAVSESQITKLFNGMPKETAGATVGITADSFVAFNSMLDVLIDAATPAAANAPIKKAATPAALVSEAKRPMPKKDRELKIGSLGSTTTPTSTAADAAAALGADSSTVLSAQELAELQKLDQADNMLNSGSFGDFDQLIGDLNDPRLQALREERDGADQVTGELKEIIDELLSLSGSLGRCGLDRPSEEDSARIRDLIQGIIEKAPPVADSRDVDDIRQTVNGRWKLLYSNSEMFDFYNGVTGFANVFPASKFQSLSLEYASDGYLSESKYLETLSTPLGNLDATVYANWDLVKEMSFMTNKNSIVLRNYCSKVTAGPMEYLAEENWKSLRTVAMNEIVYIDDRVKICRNCGALRIYFVFARE